jgi:hypothetical protein
VEGMERQQDGGLEPSEEQQLLGLLRSDRALRWMGRGFGADPTLGNPEPFDHRAMDGLVERGLVRVMEHPVTGATPLLAYKLTSRGGVKAEQLLRSLRSGRRRAEMPAGGGR